MKPLILIFSIVTCLLSYASAQNVIDPTLSEKEHLLDGKNFTYQYQSGAAIKIQFHDHQLTYKWIAGPNAHKPERTFPYQSRKLDTGVYYVNWHEVALENFITLVFNFNNNTCASSVIVKYRSDNPRVSFQGGIIEHVQHSTSVECLVVTFYAIATEVKSFKLLPPVGVYHKLNSSSNVKYPKRIPSGQTQGPPLEWFCDAQIGTSTIAPLELFSWQLQVTQRISKHTFSRLNKKVRAT